MGDGHTWDVGGSGGSVRRSDFAAVLFFGDVALSPIGAQQSNSNTYLKSVSLSYIQISHVDVGT